MHDDRPAFEALFDDWTADIAERHPEADANTWASFRRTMFGGDFWFGASREDVAAYRTPLSVLRGDDLDHPVSISHAVVEAAPDAGTRPIARAPRSWPRMRTSPHIEAHVRITFASNVL